MRMLLLLALITGCARQGELRVAAAASLQDALKEIGAGYQRAGGDRIVFAYGGSNMLARQIRAGAPVDVFFAADDKTMNSVSDLIVPGSRRALLSNRLVVVSTHPLRNVAELIGRNRIALGDPNAVPAGVYAREYFERAGVWRDIAPKVIPTENVRAALAAVDGGNADAAVVYRTDALLARRARIAFEISGAEAPTIIYPVAIVRATKHLHAAQRFVDYLATPSAAAVFRKFGFIVRETAPPIPPPPRPASARSQGTTLTLPARRRW